MAVQIAFGEVGGMVGGHTVPALRYNANLATETIEETALNQTTTITCDVLGAIARIATDATVYVSFGAAPNATSDAGRIMVLAGAVEYVFVALGDKAAVVVVA